jgi:hypothetical protein
MPYLAAVHQIMGEKNPGLAAGLTEERKPEGITPFPEHQPGNDLTKPQNCPNGRTTSHAHGVKGRGYTPV